LGQSWHVVRYESLVTDFEHEMRAICEFLNLEGAAGMGDFAGRVQQRERATPSTAQLARGLVNSGLDTWRHYSVPLQPILPTLNPWVERLGYPA
jgi:hypothetical protein